MLTTFKELDAINQILSAIGSSPVTSLEDSTDIDVINARRILNNTSRDVQRTGWNFNTITLKMQPDSETHKISWDDTVLMLKSVDDNVYIRRSGFVYNQTEQTSTFSKSISVTVIQGLDFDDLPDCFKNYITALAALEFQIKYFNDGTSSQSLQYQVQTAYQEIVKYDMDMGNYNMLQLTNIASVLSRN